MAESNAEIARRAIRRLRLCIERRWDRWRAPWPIVGECFSSHLRGQVCQQCHPTHPHEWRAWRGAPAWVGSNGVPVRCRRCGARKCDRPLCYLRRHDGHAHG